METARFCRRASFFLFGFSLAAAPSDSFVFMGVHSWSPTCHDLPDLVPQAPLGMGNEQLVPSPAIGHLICPKHAAVL